MTIWPLFISTVHCSEVLYEYNNTIDTQIVPSPFHICLHRSSKFQPIIKSGPSHVWLMSHALISYCQQVLKHTRAHPIHTFMIDSSKLRESRKEERGTMKGWVMQDILTALPSYNFFHIFFFDAKINNAIIGCLMWHFMLGRKLRYWI